MEKEIKSRFLFCAYFIMLYEQFLISIKEYSKIPFSNGDYNIEENRFGQKIFSIKVANEKMKDYCKLVKTEKNKTLSLFRWAKEFGLIDHEDYDILKDDIIVLRNYYVHEFADSIFQKTINHEEYCLLDKLKMIRIKANNRALIFFDDISVEENEITNMTDRCFNEIYLILKQDLRLQ